MSIVIKTFILTIFTLCICSCLSDFQSKEHPKDEQLIENFQNHKTEFDQLIQMFREDKSLGRVGPDFTRTADFFERCESKNSWNGKEIEVSEKRLSDYRHLFEILKLPMGIEGYCEKKTIWLYASSRGLSVSGSSKGYAYVIDKPELIIESLDDYHPKDEKSLPAFRLIEGNWYLFLD